MCHSGILGYTCEHILPKIPATGRFSFGHLEECVQNRNNLHLESVSASQTQHRKLQGVQWKVETL